MHDTLPMLSEEDVRGLVTLRDAMGVVRQVFADTARDLAVNFPVVRESLKPGGSVFGVKSAHYPSHGVVGLKAGGYFPANLARGGTAHQSVVLLFDQETGQPCAMVGGNLITRLRTAAAAAVSIDLLAKKDAATLAVIGAGAQAQTHIEAALLVRRFQKVSIWNRDPARAQALVRRLSGTVPIVLAANSARTAVADADVVITLTAATAPVLERDWIPAGCHLACMGADTAGKQEVDARLVAASRLFTDAVKQSVTIGECQMAFRSGAIAPTDIVHLGKLLNHSAPGRQTLQDITLYDGTGVAAQDIAMAAFAMDRASS
jgi:alanine dehydrogenase